MAKILIVEDEPHIAEGLIFNLQKAGHEVRWAKDGEEGLSFWKEQVPDLLVLDLMLPKKDGLSLLEDIRQLDDRSPILVLSAKNQAQDRVKCLKRGVDDYLGKPFDLDEFLARVERLLKQASWYKDKRIEKYIFGNNSIDFKTGEASHKGKKFQLTEQEIRVLELLIENEGGPTSRSELLEKGWGYSGETHTRTVDNFLVRLRKYFEDDPKNPKHFKSLRSVGYAFYKGE